MVKTLKLEFQLEVLEGKTLRIKNALEPPKPTKGKIVTFLRVKLILRNRIPETYIIMEEREK